MRKVFLFMMVSLDGYMEGEGHDLSWHHVDTEFNDFAAKQMDEADTILFGRRTYELMASFWPSPAGLGGDPVVASKMNNTPKIVFSKTLKKVEETEHWKNIRHIKDNIAEEIQKLKEQPGKGIIVLGSNNLCVTLLENNLLDEIRLMINPVAIGKGTPLFAGLKNKKEFTLASTHTFSSGNILLCYQTR